MAMDGSEEKEDVMECEFYIAYLGYISFATQVVLASISSSHETSTCGGSTLFPCPNFIPAY
jgi:hypothetical protein